MVSTSVVILLLTRCFQVKPQTTQSRDQLELTDFGLFVFTAVSLLPLSAAHSLLVATPIIAVSFIVIVAAGVLISEVVVLKLFHRVCFDT